MHLGCGPTETETNLSISASSTGLLIPRILKVDSKVAITIDCTSAEESTCWVLKSKRSNKTSAQTISLHLSLGVMTHWQQIAKPENNSRASTVVIPSRSQTEKISCPSVCPNPNTDRNSSRSRLNPSHLFLNSPRHSRNLSIESASSDSTRQQLVLCSFLSQWTSRLEH